MSARIFSMTAGSSIADLLVEALDDVLTRHG
jgi:hypothetical protein